MKDLAVVILDTQTTGMRPPKGALLEMSWTVVRARDTEVKITSRRVQLPEGHSIPKSVKEITGLSEDDQDPQVQPRNLAAEFVQSLKAMGLSAPIPVVIHYAQFEKPFLNELLGRDGHSLSILCSQQLTKLVLPDLPSANIRAVAGYYGHPLIGANRSETFVRANVAIWQGLVQDLETKGFETFEQLKAWMAATDKPKSTKYAYRIDRLKRLNLPAQPGVYRMLAKNGDILYIGKATSLRDRVNSYFRGKKGRDTKKLEMLAQVWNLKVTETRSAMEASLLETDEIKKHNPRYNNLLKQGRRIVFYDRELKTQSYNCSHIHNLGPFREMSLIESLRQIHKSLAQGHFEMIFFQEIDQALVKEAWAIFSKQIGLDLEIPSTRRLLYEAVKLFRRLGEPQAKVKTSEDTVEVEDDLEVEEVEITAEELAAKFERLFRRAGSALLRARRMTRLLNSKWEYQNGDERLTLEIKSGLINPSEPFTQGKGWQGLGLETYDRLSIFLNEISRLEHRPIKA